MNNDRYPKFNYNIVEKNKQEEVKSIYTDDKTILKEKNVKNLFNTISKKKLPEYSNYNRMSIPLTQCTYEVSKKNNWFSLEKPTLFFGNFDKINENKIQITKEDIIENKKPYSICTTNKTFDKSYENCSITSPWRTLVNGKCQINNICPPSFTFKDGKCIIPDNNLHFFKRDKIGFCEEKWYDWFSIPNIHLQNGYQKYVKLGSNPKDITSCYKPCKLGEIPFNKNIKDVSNSNHIKCIKKNTANFGLYIPNDYCPISMIPLLSVNKYNLYKSYSKLIQKIPEKKRDLDIYNNIQNKTENNEIINTAIDEIIFNAKKYVTDTSISISDLIHPKLGDIEFDLCLDLVTVDNIIDSYDICTHFTNIEKKNKIIETIKLTYNYSDDRIFNKHIQLLEKACSKCFEIQSKDSIFSIVNNDYAYATLNKMNGEFPLKERPPLSFDGTQIGIIEKKIKITIENPLFSNIFDFGKLFGNYSNLDNLQYSYNKFYELPNLFIYFLTSLIFGIFIYILFRLCIILYPHIKDILILIGWLITESLIWIYTIFSTPGLLPLHTFENFFKKYLFK
jgi:hypothetical protein